MGTHPIFESDFDCLTEMNISSWSRNRQQGKSCRLRRKGGKAVCVGGNRLIPDGRFRYCQTLVKHTGCVNALAFSKNENFLFSGGDDMQVQMWNLLTSGAPEPLAVRHFSNIFCLSTDLYSERLLSGGNDRMVICHDLKTGGAREILKFTTAVHSTDFSPLHNCLVFAVTDGGKLHLRDLRSRDCTLEGIELGKCRGPMRSLSCHPHGNGFIATTGRANGVVIFDVRSPGKPLMKLLHPGPHGPPDLHQVGRLYRNTPARNHDFSGVKWNRNGRELVALGHDGAYLVDVYHPEKIKKIFDQSYENKITVKNIEWIGDDIIAAGSDSSSVYIAHARNSNQYILHGHRSVVNQVAYNKSLNLLASSGVEKIIKLRSKFNQELFPRSRPLDVTIEKTTGSPPSGSEDRNDDEEIIAFFAALREESNTVSSRLEADANSIVGTQRMTNFYGPDDSETSSSDESNEYNFEIESSSSDSSGILEPLSRTENERLAELERLDIARRIHRDRQRLVQHLGGSGPSTALESPQLTESSSSAEETEDRRQKTRQKNSKRRKRS